MIDIIITAVGKEGAPALTLSVKKLVASVSAFVPGQEFTLESAEDGRRFCEWLLANQTQADNWVVDDGTNIILYPPPHRIHSVDFQGT